MGDAIQTMQDAWPLLGQLQATDASARWLRGPDGLLYVRMVPVTQSAWRFDRHRGPDSAPASLLVWHEETAAQLDLAHAIDLVRSHGLLLTEWLRPCGLTQGTPALAVCLLGGVPLCRLPALTPSQAAALLCQVLQALIGLQERGLHWPRPRAEHLELAEGRVRLAHLRHIVTASMQSSAEEGSLSWDLAILLTRLRRGGAAGHMWERHMRGATDLARRRMRAELTAHWGGRVKLVMLDGMGRGRADPFFLHHMLWCICCSLGSEVCTLEQLSSHL